MSTTKPLDQHTLTQLHALYSLGTYSNVALAEQFGISEGVVRKYAKRFGWSRDNSRVIRSEAKAINQREIAADTAGSTVDQVTEAAVIKATAAAQARVQRDHQQWADKLKAHAGKLYAQIDAATDEVARLREMVDKVIASPEGADVVPHLQQIIGALANGERVKAFKALVEATDKVITLERKAYDMDVDADNAPTSVEEHLLGLLSKAPAAPGGESAGA